MKINHYWEKQIGGTREDFIEFVKVATDDLTEEDIDDIDFLVHKVAQNLFYFEDNIETAKTDYICLIRLLMMKGVIFEGK